MQFGQINRRSLTVFPADRSESEAITRLYSSSSRVLNADNPHLVSARSTLLLIIWAELAALLLENPV